jgi:hypothetical protein
MKLKILLPFTLLCLLSLVAFVACNGGGGDGDDNGTSGPASVPTPTPTPVPFLFDLQVLLTWEAPINMELIVEEPDTSVATPGGDGTTAQSTGDNTCGFTDACVNSDCADLPCGTPEEIVVQKGDALPDTTGPDNVYTVAVFNLDLSDRAATITIETERSFQRFDCVIPGPGVRTTIATIAFPSETITDISPAGVCN